MTNEQARLKHHSENQIKLLAALEKELENLQFEILATPTGLRRAKLCDANIVLTEAVTHLRIATDTTFPTE